MRESIHPVVLSDSDRIRPFPSYWPFFRLEAPCFSTWGATATERDGGCEIQTLRNLIAVIIEQIRS
jgi:hypothetical protein